MQLEYELQIVNNKYMEYESIINQMEHDMVQIQKIWNKGQNQQSKTDTHNIATSPTLQENKHASVQAIVDLSPKGIQTDPYTCCLNKKETNEVEVQTICFEENDDSENLKFEEKTKEESSVCQQASIDNTLTRTHSTRSNGPLINHREGSN